MSRMGIWRRKRNKFPYLKNKKVRLIKQVDPQSTRTNKKEYKKQEKERAQQSTKSKQKTLK